MKSEDERFKSSRDGADSNPATAKSPSASLPTPLNMSSEVDRYFELGWRPTPIKAKKPYREGWQLERLSKDEFQRMLKPWDNVGIITGWLVEGKLGLIAIDVDQPDLIGFNHGLWIEKGAMAHATSVGPRLVFYTDSPEVIRFLRKITVAPDELSDVERKLLNWKAEGKESITVIEVLGEGRQFMAPPSRHPDTGEALVWVVPPKPPQEALVVHSLDELKALMDRSITRARWVFEELFETSKVEAGFDAELLSNWLEMIKGRLRFAGETKNYYQFHCPFHPPDNKPSFVIHKSKFYAFDYHDDATYSLKALAKKLEINLTPPKEVLGCGVGQSITREAAVEVGDTFTYTGDQPFYGRIQVAALGFPQSRYMRLTFHCAKSKEDCPQCDLTSHISLNFDSSNMDPSAFATYFDTDIPRDALRMLTERGIKHGCPAWWNSTVCKGEDERAVTQAVVMDRRGIEGRAWFVHGPRCDLKRAPNWIIAEGWLCKGKQGRIGVLVYAFTPESEVATPKPEDVEKARFKLQSLVNPNDEGLHASVLWKVAEALQRKSNLKGSEIVKGFASDIITVGSPVWVKTPEGPAQLGATTCELGPTTAAKSLRVRMFIDLLESGKYDTGRKTPAGLTAGAEKTEGMGWIVRKGLLPSMDLSWLVIDNMPPHALDSQIESRRDGVVTITAIRSAELWARCRLKLLSNPSRPFDETLYKCTALKTYDPKLIARFAFALFTYGVSTEERYSQEIVKPQPGDSELLEAAKTMLRWNLSHENTFTVPDRLWPTIMEYGRKLEETYGCEDIPLLLRANPYKLALLAYSFALLEGAQDPTDRHVRLAYEWLDFCAKDIELDKYVEWWRSQHLLSEEEYNASKAQIESEIAADIKEHGGGKEEAYIFKFVEYLAKNEKGQRDEIAAYANIEPQTVSVKARLLKGLGLLKSDRDGYHFTAKGVRFFRRWFSETAPITEITQITDFKGQRGVGAEVSIGPEGGVTPKIGKLSNFCNRKPILGNVLAKLRAECNGLTEEEWKRRMVEMGLSREEADSLFQSLAGNELFWHDRDGKTVWSWA